MRSVRVVVSEEPFGVAALAVHLQSLYGVFRHRDELDVGDPGGGALIGARSCAISDLHGPLAENEILTRQIRCFPEQFVNASGAIGRSRQLSVSFSLRRQLRHLHHGERGVSTQPRQKLDRKQVLRKHAKMHLMPSLHIQLADNVGGGCLWSCHEHGAGECIGFVGQSTPVASLGFGGKQVCWLALAQVAQIYGQNKTPNPTAPPEPSRAGLMSSKPLKRYSTTA